MKVRSSVKPICEKCKIIKRKEASESSVRTRNINSVRVNLYQTENCLFELSAAAV